MPTAKRFVVQRWLPEGRYMTEYVSAWDFTILGDVLVFSRQNKTVAFRDWLTVKQED